MIINGYITESFTRGGERALRIVIPSLATQLHCSDSTQASVVIQAYLLETFSIFAHVSVVQGRGGGVEIRIRLPMEDTPKICGVMLRSLRKYNGLTQAQVVARMGTEGVSKYENAARSPSISYFERVLSALGYQLMLSVEPLGKKKGKREKASLAGGKPHSARVRRKRSSVS